MIKFSLFILLIFLILYISCVREPNCGTCRVYTYEHNGLGEFRTKMISEKLYCGEYYKSEITIDTLSDNWILQTQKECY